MLSDSQRKTKRTLYAQITRRILPIIIVIFAAFAIIGTAIVHSSIRTRLDLIHQSALAERSLKITKFLQDTLNNTVKAATSDAARAFALQTRVAESTGVEEVSGQAQLFAQMTSLMNDPTLVRIRFITQAGSVWTEITTNNNTHRSNPYIQKDLLSGDLFLNRVISTNQTTLTPPMMQPTPSGQIEPLLRLLVPVTATSASVEVLGAIEVQLLATPILNIIYETKTQSQQQWLLINKQGQYIANSKAPNAYRAGLAPGANITLANTEPELDLLFRNTVGDTYLLQSGNNLVSAVSIDLDVNAPGMPWTLIVIDNPGLSFGSMYFATVVLVLGCTVAGAGTLFVVNRILRKRLELLNTARTVGFHLAEGRIPEVPLPPNFAQNDELGELLSSLKNVSARFQDLNLDLDNQTKRHSRNLEVAARVSQETAAVSDITALLKRVPDLISKESGFYHTQIFQVDDINQNAILMYSRGSVGQRLLQQQYRVPVRSKNMIGLVSGTGEALIINDLQNSNSAPLIDPEFPQTRARMALPMKIEKRVIGVLDIHSLSADVFLDDELNTFQMLANQLAIAMNNARRFAQSQQRIEQVELLNRQLTRSAWEEIGQRVGLQNAYYYNLMDVKPVTEELPVEQALTAAISIRGEVIGTIAAVPQPDQPFTRSDQAILKAVAERVGLTIEGARLFKETQVSLAVTSTLYELSRYLNEANSLDEVIRAIVISVMSDALGGQIWLFDDYPPNTLPQWLEVTASWMVIEQNQANPLGLRLYIPDSQFLSSLQSDRVKLVTNVGLDQRLDDHLRIMLHEWSAQAAAFVPFSVRGIWRGIITIEFAQPREFTESEGRIYSALIDQAGVAIDNRLLFRQTETTLDRIERLYAASRIINSAQTPYDLVRAALASTRDPNLYFELGLLEGELDNTGWPSQVHKIARSDGTQVYEINERETIEIGPLSPLRHREPFIQSQLYELPRVSALFPMFSANLPVAILYIHNREESGMSSDDYEVYQALTGQMSTVLENQRLLDRTAQALDETRRLYAASRAIAGAPDSNTVYRTATDSLAAATQQVSRISILLAGPNPTLDASYLDTVHVWERQPDPQAMIQTGIRLPSDTMPLGNLLAQTGELIYFRDLDSELNELPRLRQVLQRSGAHSALIVPIRSQRHWFGVVICDSDHTEEFEEQYLRFVQAVTDQVAIAVENRHLFEEARLEAQRALALAEVGQLATRIGSEFERNISTVFARIAETAGYDRWLVTLINDDQPDRLDKISWHSPTQEVDGELYFDLTSSQHSLVDAVRTNRIIIINDPGRYPAFSDYSAEMLLGIGKHIVTPVHVGDRMAGALLVGRRLEGIDLDERDEQLVNTLAAQVAVAVENRRLFRAVEDEREYLRSILDTMPTGILVLDAQNFKPLQFNAQAENLLGRSIITDVGFSAEAYNLYRTGTNVFYPADEMPVYVVSNTGQQDSSDDIAVIHEDGSQTDLLLNAAPIHDLRGNTLAIVAAFQDISNLRGLENALQDNLRETIALYEATRTLAEASELDEVLNIVIMQLIMLEAADGYIVLLEPDTGDLKVARALFEPENFNVPTGVFLADALLLTEVQSSDKIGDETRVQLEERGIQALASMPLRTRDTLLGWLIALYQEPHTFTPEDERFLITLGDSAAVAIDNRNLLQRTEDAYQEATTLYKAGRALANAADAEDVLQAVVMHLDQSRVTQVFMALPPSNASTLTPQTIQVVANWQRDPSIGVNLLGIELSPEQFPAWKQLFSPELLVVDDTQTDERLDEMERMGLESLETRALAVLPLRTTSGLIGAIWIGMNETYRHLERDLRIYQSFAEQASLSIETKRLLAQTERRARQLGTSAAVSQIASAILELNELLPRLVDVIRDAFGYDHVQIFLMDSTDTYAELAASTGEAGRQLLSIKHKLAKGSASVIGQVTATGGPVLALDTADTRFVHKPNPYLPLTRSEMAVPLSAKNQVIGALDIQSNQPNAFTDEDVELLTTLAAQISVAIDNARLFEQSEQRARDMSFLFTVTAAAALPEQTLNESLQNVAELILTNLDTLVVGIYLVDTYADQQGKETSLLKAAALAGSSQPLAGIAEVLIGDPNHALGVAAKRMEALIIPNIQRERNYLPIMPSSLSAIAVPLGAGNKLVGVMVLEDDRPNAYNLETLTLLRTLTSTLSAIIENARLLVQVQKQNEMLREVDRMKSDFLANMSHELRTPLNSIIGFSRVILKGIDGPLTEMQEQDLTTIYGSGQHLLGLINDILDQAKIASGKMELQIDYFEIKPVMEGVRSIGIGLVKDKPIDIRLDAASGLPKCYGDEFRTRQVLLNLVSNASKFTQEGSITIRASKVWSNEVGRDMIRVDVIDTGIGIAEKDMPLLFEAFRQVDSSLTRTVGGTGLGLPISKSLVEMQGGQMLVTSEVNVGSTFSILIPLEPVVTDQNDTPDETPVSVRQTGKLPPEPAQPVGAAPTMNGGNGANSDIMDTKPPASRSRNTTASMPIIPQVKRQILLIEDNPVMVDQFRRLLQREGFDIFAASIPLEAEAMVSGLQPTLIIMDVDFAHGAGWDILTKIQEREDTCDIPVIVVTLNGNKERAYQNGAYLFIQRPFTPDQLVAAVQKAEQESKTERILIIDDQPDSIRLLKQLLEQQGKYRIFTAHSGTEGISLVARRRPDLVILDLRMPEMDGFAVLDELRHQVEAANIPVLIVTADTLNPDEQNRLNDVPVLYKTTLSDENYHSLIDSIQSHLNNQNGE